MTPGAMTLDRQLRVVAADETALAMLGRTLPALLDDTGASWLVAPDGAPLAGAEHPAVRALSTERATAPTVLAVRRPDGSLRLARVAARTSRDGVTLTLDDLGTEAALGAELARLRRLEDVVHGIDDYIYVWEYRPDGSSVPIVESIPSTVFFGIEPQPGSDDAELWWERILPQDRDAYGAVVGAQARGRGGTGEYRIVRDDGSIAHVYDRWSGLLRPDGVAVVQGVISDITPMREAQEASRRSAARFEALAASAPVGIFIADPDARVIWANARWREIYGLGPDGPLDRWIAALDPMVRPVAIAAWLRAVRRGEPYEGTLRLRSPDGPRHIASRARPVLDDDGRITGYVGTDDDMTDRVVAAERLDALARTDALTGLANRRHLTERLTRALAATAAGRVGLVLIDVDHFKRVNDTHGHEAGDDILRAVAARIAGIERDVVTARYGGEEFVVLAADVANDADLRALAEAARGAIAAAPVPTGAGEIAVTASAGAARATAGMDADRLLAAADEALYAAKRRGRDRTVLAAEVTDADRAAEDPAALRVARGLAHAASIREDMPALHFEQVGDLAAATAERLGLDDAAVMMCRIAGILHDVGKLAIPDVVLHKRGTLDEEEWRLMRSHAEVGAGIVARTPGLEGACEAVRHHHERWDGRGYPAGLAGTAIPLPARIVAAADAYVSMTADRAYAAGADGESAVAELRRSAGSQLDPDVVAALCDALDELASAAAARLQRRLDAA